MYYHRDAKKKSGTMRWMGRDERSKEKELSASERFWKGAISIIDFFLDLALLTGLVSGLSYLTGLVSGLNSFDGALVFGLSSFSTACWRTHTTMLFSKMSYALFLYPNEFPNNFMKCAVVYCTFLCHFLMSVLIMLALSSIGNSSLQIST